MPRRSSCCSEVGHSWASWCDHLLMMLRMWLRWLVIVPTWHHKASRRPNTSPTWPQVGAKLGAKMGPTSLPLRAQGISKKCPTKASKVKAPPDPGLGTTQGPMLLCASSEANGQQGVPPNPPALSISAKYLPRVLYTRALDTLYSSNLVL